MFFFKKKNIILSINTVLLLECSSVMNTEKYVNYGAYFVIKSTN